MESFSFIENFFFVVIFFSQKKWRNIEILQKKEKKKGKKITMGKGSKIIFVGAINVSLSGSHL